MLDLVGNPEDRFSRVAAQIMKQIVCISCDILEDNVTVTNESHVHPIKTLVTINAHQGLFQSICA